MKIKKSAIIYWWKMRPIKKEYKRIAKELDRIQKEIKEVQTEISLLSGGSGDPLPAGSGLASIKKEYHAINNS
jgi:hypothetical protein